MKWVMKNKKTGEYMSGNWWPRPTTEIWSAGRFNSKEEALNVMNAPYTDKKVFAEYEPVEIELIEK